MNAREQRSHRVFDPCDPHAGHASCRGHLLPDRYGAAIARHDEAPKSNFVEDKSWILTVTKAAAGLLGRRVTKVEERGIVGAGMSVLTPGVRQYLTRQDAGLAITSSVQSSVDEPWCDATAGENKDDDTTCA